MINECQPGWHSLIPAKGLPGWHSFVLCPGLLLGKSVLFNSKEQYNITKPYGGNPMAAIFQKLDESILFFIQEHLKNPVMDRFMVFVTSLGNAGFLWIFIAFLLLCRKPYQKCGLSLICAISLSMFVGDEVLKPLVGRLRPNVSFPEIPLLIGSIHSRSFPSGHTMVAFASAAVIYSYYKFAGILTYVAAALIAYSRLYLFVHYPTDILGGIVLGSILAYLIVKAVDRLYSYQHNMPTL